MMNTTKEGIRATVYKWMNLLIGEDLQKAAPILKIVDVINETFPFDEYLVSWSFHITPVSNPQFVFHFNCDGERFIEFVIRESMFAVNFSGLFGCGYYIPMNYNNLLHHLEFWSEKALQRMIQKEEGWVEEPNGWKSFVDFNSKMIKTCF